MPRGTVAPSFLKRAGSRRNSTTSWSSAFASSAPATSAQPIAVLDSALISVGLVRGIIFSVFQMKKTSRPMKMIGAQVWSHVEMWSHEYQCSVGALTVTVLDCASSVYSGGLPAECQAGFSAAYA